MSMSIRLRVLKDTLKENEQIFKDANYEVIQLDLTKWNMMHRNKLIFPVAKGILLSVHETFNLLANPPIFGGLCNYFQEDGFEGMKQKIWRQ